MILLSSLTQQLDQLLDFLCAEIQITDTQYENAKRSYQAVSDWLHGGNLAKLNPDIFPQGSMALGTTVKPRAREEFDVDLVCLLNLDPDLIGPMAVYELVYARLAEHDVYGPMIERMPRCIRLNYKGQFHLDIIPACPRPQWLHLYGDSSIVIPDCEKKRWIKTNPKGFVRWFATQALGVLAERRGIQLSAAPLPPNVDASEKAPLQRIVQLYKRRRDVHYNGHDHAPKSILLTALDGMHYGGAPGITGGVIGILDKLVMEYDLLAPGTVPTVPNPTNPNENLARHWKENAGHYQRFITYVVAFRDGMQRLLDATNLPARAKILNELFDPAGTGVVERAVRSYHDVVQGVRQDGGIRLQTGTGTNGHKLTTAVASSIAVAPTNFFGDE